MPRFYIEVLVCAVVKLNLLSNKLPRGRYVRRKRLRARYGLSTVEHHRVAVHPLRVSDVCAAILRRRGRHYCIKVPVFVVPDGEVAFCRRRSGLIPRMGF